MTHPVILTLADYYVPAFRAGGPPRTISHLVSHLGHEFAFRVLTRDRDLGCDAPLPVPRGTWTRMGACDVKYLRPEETRFAAMGRMIAETPYDALYLNSLFSSRFSIFPLLLRKRGRIRRTPVVLAPRGELAESALRKGPIKKRFCLAALRALGVFEEVIWQASSDHEAADIRRVLGATAPVWLAQDAPPHGMAGRAAPRSKSAGKLRILFLSRLHRVKNLDGALHMLAGLRGEIEFQIYGPVEDRAYWEECQAIARNAPANVRTRYCGAVEPDRVPQVMQDHDVLLLPSRGENFGQVILEALLQGRPVVISDRTAWRGLAAHGAGWDLPLEDRAAFRAALQELIDTDGAAYGAMCENAARFGVRFCAESDVIERNRQLFRFASGGGSPVELPTPRTSAQAA